MRQHAITAPDRAVGELRTALVGAGTQLPFLSVDLLLPPPAHQYPVITLGRCSAETAQALAHALRKDPSCRNH
ncbi:hypothetical protein [Streptomyces xiaopingdaonensis]|uniref:hypothetical protein n=1 Tax=Streptomyces xiaopingdaonensis TaxID=1565415 RepID=UPI00036EFA94|nr:hypothetical protein [Streptomyces xiaopingdaonensis]